MIEGIVAGLHLRWDGVWQRPHHILSRLAHHVPLVVVEEPFPAREDRDEVRSFGALHVVRPLRAWREGLPAIDARAVAAARALAPRANLVWLYTPMMIALADALAPAPVVYDCMDDLASFDFAPPQMRSNERLLLERAALVFAGGRSLYASRASYGAKVHLEASGVEFERFSAAPSLAPHPVMRDLPRPRYAYTGVIDERLDYGLLEALADSPAHPNIVMIGPTTKVDPARLPRRTNVHFTGWAPYDSLPSYLAGADVAIMPFANNASTRSISPTKTLEYFAARVPVATTPIADVLAEYGALVETGEGGAAFIAACARAAAAPATRLDQAQEAARARGWDALTERMWRLLPRAPRSVS